MNQISLRFYAFFCLLLMQLQAWAQDDYDDEGSPLEGRGVKNDNLEELFQDMEQVPQIHIRFSDILWTIIIIALCYVYGKIWKGCTYLIIAMVALYIYFFRL